MKNKMKASNLKLVGILIISISLFANAPVSSQNSEKGNSNIKSIALISTMIGKIVQPPLPLLDAPPFNKKTNSIAPLLIKAEEESIDGYRDAVASSLKKHFNCEVVYGNSLITTPKYQEVIKKYNYPDNLKIDDVNFPKIIIPKDETNLFMFDNGKKVFQFLKDKNKTQSTTSEICKLLGTDLVAVSYTHIAPKKIGAFGGHAKLVLFTVIYLYNKEGKLIGSKFFFGLWNDPVKAVGDDIKDYKTVLNCFPGAVDELIVKVSQKVNK